MATLTPVPFTADIYKETDRRVHEHLNNEEDVISNDDIKNARVVPATNDESVSSINQNGAAGEGSEADEA